MTVPITRARGLHRWLPSLVLVGAVVVFAVFVSSARAITWTGPGFSMFSAADYRATRIVQVELETSQGVFPARVGAVDGVAGLIEVPSETNADHLGANLLAMRWELVDGVFEPKPDGAVVATVAFIELWTAPLHDDMLWPELILMRQVNS